MFILPISLLFSSLLGSFLSLLSFFLSFTHSVSPLFFFSLLALVGCPSLSLKPTCYARLRCSVDRRAAQSGARPFFLLFPALPASAASSPVAGETTQSAEGRPATSSFPCLLNRIFKTLVGSNNTHAIVSVNAFFTSHPLLKNERKNGEKDVKRRIIERKKLCCHFNTTYKTSNKYFFPDTCNCVLFLFDLPFFLPFVANDFPSGVVGDLVQLLEQSGIDDRRGKVDFILLLQEE